MSSQDLCPIDELRYKLLGSFLDFTRYFYKIRTARKFEVPEPFGRESHYITIARALTKVFNLQTKKLLINIPPRYGKTELIIQFIAWGLARYPDSNFIYTSYSKTLATKQTATVRQIITHPEYQRLYDNVQLSDDTQAKDNFETTSGGSVYAAGAGGSITGRGAGIAHCPRFSGAIIIDDIIKPNEATSETIREDRNEWYKNTLLSRKNTPETPIIYIGQRVHEADLAGKLLDGFDGDEWETIILPALDDHGNALLPTMHTSEDLKKMIQTSPYVASAQYQQNPMPAGGGIFKRDYFVQTEDIPPNITTTFITADTAETEKTYNDATAFSFWGIYQIVQNGVNTGVYALHWLDCLQIWCEPKDLKQNFLTFWSNCCRYPIHPKFCFIEKKSTGSTLLSVLQEIVGLAAIEIPRNNTHLSKADRFLAAQPFVASHQISITKEAKHAKMCLDHMVKITANDSHRYDDIADTLSDAVQLALVEKRFTVQEQRVVNLYGSRPIVLGSVR